MKMSYEEFLRKIMEMYGIGISGFNKKNDERPKIYVSWLTGGMGGGDCWGNEPSYSVESDPEPEFEQLDEFLESLFPNMSFMQYRRLMRECLHYEQTRNYEYYGNYSVYSIKYVYVEELYRFLVNNNLLEN